MKGAEFERRVQKLAKEKELSCFSVAAKGKGSHGRLYLGSEFTTLKDRKKELGRAPRQDVPRSQDPDRGAIAAI